MTHSNAPSQSRPIAFFLPNLEGGGAERIMVTIANECARRGHSVDLVLGEAVGPYLSSVDSGVNIVDLEAKKILASLFPLCSYLWKRKPRALISALNRANLVALGAGMLTGRRTPIVVSERNHLSAATLSETGRYGRILPKLIQALYPFSMKVVAISQGVADDLVETAGLKREKVAVIHNPIDFEKVRQMAQKPIDDGDIELDGPIILAVGRLHPQKDFVTLLNAFSILRKTVPANLVILGEGPEKARLEEEATSLGVRQFVYMLGRKENPFSYMRKADVFVLSSRHEGFGNVLVEAMACGCKVVSTNCPSGPSEILEDGRWGVLIPVGEPKAMAEAINRALVEPHRAGVVERAKVFSISSAADAYLATAGIQS